MIIDATCCPANIRYPTDISLLNEAREKCEKIIDHLYHYAKESGIKKPRDYRQNAHCDFIEFIKKRRPGLKTRRKAVKTQLQYLRRDLKYVKALLGYMKSDSISIAIWKQLVTLEE